MRYQFCQVLNITKLWPDCHSELFACDTGIVMVCIGPELSFANFTRLSPVYINSVGEGDLEYLMFTVIEAAAGRYTMIGIGAMAIADINLCFFSGDLMMVIGCYWRMR